MSCLDIAPNGLGRQASQYLSAAYKSGLLLYPNTVIIEIIDSRSELAPRRAFSARRPQMGAPAGELVPALKAALSSPPWIRS